MKYKIYTVKMLLSLYEENVMLINNVFSVCVLQVPVTVASVFALPKTGGCLESTVSVTTESVTNTTASSAQVKNKTHAQTGGLHQKQTCGNQP